MAEEEKLIKALSVKEFAVDPSDPDATKQYNFWIKRLTLYLTRVKADEWQKLKILINKISADTYGYIEDAANYADAVKKLDEIFKKHPNVLYARYKLNTTNQNPGESKDAYALRLTMLAKSCNSEDVNAKNLPR